MKVGDKILEGILNGLLKHLPEEYLVSMAQELQLMRKLKELLPEIVEYFDQRADIHKDNPHVPNEEMRLDYELSQALSALDKMEEE